jgi:hypothetical protein
MNTGVVQNSELDQEQVGELMEFLCRKAFDKLDPSVPEAKFDFSFYDNCEVSITCNQNESVKLFVNSILSSDDQ